jgi:hypothetical protein
VLKGKSVLAYTAGIVDGEGCIHIAKNKKKQYSLRVIVTNTNEWLVKWFKMEYGGSITIRPCNKSKNTRTSYQWVISTSQAYDFLKLVLPYLMIKRPQAEVAIVFHQAKKQLSGKTEEERIFEEAQYLLIRRYNKTGFLQEV